MGVAFSNPIRIYKSGVGFSFWGARVDNQTPKIWALKGEAVTCIQGHAICDVARNIYVGDARASADFTNWHQPEPDISTPVTDLCCAQCRGVWIRGNTTAGYQFHFGAPPHGEWR